MFLSYFFCITSLIIVQAYCSPVNVSGTATIGETWIQFPDGDGRPHWVNLDQPPVEVFLNGERDVSFLLYTQRHPVNPVRLYLGQDNTLSDLNFREPTNFVIHGWNSKGKSLSHVRSAFIEHDNSNVIVVDWARPASGLYSTSKAVVKDVGAYVARFLDYLASRGLNLATVHIIGHSLGAHVAGCAGSRVTAGVVGKITGLDPAAPLFGNDALHDRLDRTDAAFVQVIHTNGGLLGWDDEMGDVDFYPNNGRSQPGCGIDLVGACAHARAHEFFAESVGSSVGFWGRLCSSWSNYANGRCNTNPRALMGARTDRGSRGAFYFRTGSSAPFALGWY